MGFFEMNNSRAKTVSRSAFGESIEQLDSFLFELGEDQNEIPNLELDDQTYLEPVV